MDYKEDLRKRLPELKKIEGFPIGEDEDIINLSNPPFYTVCPNPYIEAFLEKNGTKYDEINDNYHNEPFVTDVSEGKSDPMYMAHTYHTKVPYKAIVEYIKHYTKEEDVILDAFSGSGMAGVAAQFCNRKAILSDLSPIASFIGMNLNSDDKPLEILEEATRILNEVNLEYNKFYSTKHLNGSKGVINYVIWSDVLSCNYCENEYVFWENAVVNNNIESEYECPSCKAKINKANSKRVLYKVFDNALGREIETAKQVPVRINYKYNKKSFEKELDEDDLQIVSYCNNNAIPFWFPINEIPDGVKTSEPRRTHKYYYVHQYFTNRNLWILSAIYDKAESSKHNYFIKFLLTSFITKTGSKLHNIGMKNGKINLAGAMPNTLFIPSLFAERNIIELAKRKLKDIIKAFSSKENFSKDNVICQVGSVTHLKTIPSNSIDYVFTDPPFGENLMYSELSFIWESWLKVYTNNKSEAIINKSQNKKLDDYYLLMLNGFKEYYRIIKPKRWITVEFHNSKSSVWNSIQESLSRAGFIIAQVTILDKKQGTFNQMTAPGAVKSDLAISAFKPSIHFETKLLKESGVNMEIEFIEQFLSMLPIRNSVERTDKMLYSKLLAYYIQRGYEIRYDANAFYRLLKGNFAQEDGYWFNYSQINSYVEYKKKMKLDGIDEIKKGAMMLFVSDERSAILWLFNNLQQPKTYSEIYTAFTQVATIQDDKVPEISQLLEDNFIKENNVFRRPTSEEEHTSINIKREKVLLREFESLLIRAKNERKKIKEVRKEALMHGFEVCYKEKRFKDILIFGERLDKKILENSLELNDFVEAAKIMVEGIS